MLYPVFEKFIPKMENASLHEYDIGKSIFREYVTITGYIHLNFIYGNKVELHLPSDIVLDMSEKNNAIVGASIDITNKKKYHIFLDTDRSRLYFDIDPSVGEIILPINLILKVAYV
jgi:hypothetical protein